MAQLFHELGIVKILGCIVNEALNKIFNFCPNEDGFLSKYYEKFSHPNQTCKN